MGRRVQVVALLLILAVRVFGGDVHILGDEKSLFWWNGIYSWSEKASGSMAGNYIIIKPPNIGSTGQQLTTTVSGGTATLSWEAPGGTGGVGDIDAVGDVSSGAAFTADGTGNNLWFEGASANAYEIILTAADPGADKTITLPAETGTVVLDGTVCTDIEGTGLSITSKTLNWSAASTDLTDTADLLYEAELDDFSELQAQISDKTLVNEEDAVAFDSVVEGIVPTAGTHFTTKEYVDTAVSGLHFDMFLDNLDSTINDPETTNDYYSLQITETGAGTSTLTAYASLGEDDDQEVVSYISGASLPFAELQAGLVQAHMHARKDNTGQKDTVLFGKLYHRASGGTETLIATTEDSADLTNSWTAYNLHGNITSVVTFSATDRLLLKIRADVQSTGGGNAAIEIRQEGTESSFVSALVDTDTLSAIFVRQDGSKPLTDNWAVGGFNLSGVGTLSSGKHTITDDSVDSSLVIQNETDSAGGSLPVFLINKKQTGAEGAFAIRQGDAATSFFFEAANDLLFLADIYAHMAGGDWGTSTEVMKLNGTTGNLTIAGSLTSGSLTAGRVPFIGANGLITDGSAFTFQSGGGSTLNVVNLHTTDRVSASGGVSIGNDVFANLIDDSSNGSDSTVLYIGDETIDTTPVSDEKYKENIVDSDIGLAELMQLRVRDFNYIQSMGKGNATRTGFVAQEVQSVYPAAVKTGVRMIKEKVTIEDPNNFNIIIEPEITEEFLFVDVRKFIPILIKVTQIQQAEIEDLINRVKVLEMR